eukprot:gene2132-17719_t
MAQIAWHNNNYTGCNFYQWNGLNKIPFWIIRLILCGYAFASFVAAAVVIANRDRNHAWVIYLTSVNHVLVTVYILSCGVQSTMYIWWSRENNHNLPEGASKDTWKSQIFKVYTRFHWVMLNVAVNVTSFVFFAYWFLVSSDDREFKESRNVAIRYMTIDRHGINLLILLIDFTLSRTPMRLLHCVYPSCLVGLYFISNCIYWASTGNLVYGPVLDYGRHTGKAVGMILAAVFIIAPLIQLIWFMLYLLRRRLSKGTDAETEATYELTSCETNLIEN